MDMENSNNMQQPLSVLREFDLFSELILPCFELKDMSSLEQATASFRPHVLCSCAWVGAAGRFTSGFDLRKLVAKETPTSAAVNRRQMKALLHPLAQIPVALDSVPVSVADAAHANRLFGRATELRRVAAEHVAAGGERAGVVVASFTLSQDVLAPRECNINRPSGGGSLGPSVLGADAKISNLISVDLDACQGGSSQQNKRNKSKRRMTVAIRLACTSDSSAFVCLEVQPEDGRKTRSLPPIDENGQVLSFRIDLHVVSAGAFLRIADLRVRADGTWMRAPTVCSLPSLSPSAGRSSCTPPLACVVSVLDGMAFSFTSNSQVNALQLDRIRS